MSDASPDQSPPSVLPPPVVPDPPSPTVSVRRLWWALPMLTVSWLVLVAIIATGATTSERWETAPGSVDAVAPRLGFGAGATDVTRYRTGNSIRFVTAYGSQLTALEGFIGWVDDDIAIETKLQRFGDRSPVEQRRLGFQAMVGAKQIAEFVALKRLGYDVALNYGSVVVEQVICEADPKADSACKLLNPGDVIESLDGTPTPQLDVLVKAMEGRKVGDVVEIVVNTLNSNPNETRREESVRLIASPDDPQRTIIGIVPADTRTVDVPFEVDISTDAIGGPSAGLAFTLALLDELTPGNLMGRATVAATGTIAEDGAVGAIGALRQKAVAVKRSGADLFLVPKSQTDAEIASARAAVGSALTIVPVATLDEALDALSKYGGGKLPAPK
jgi:PDZ domain-containing protein